MSTIYLDTDDDSDYSEDFPDHCDYCEDNQIPTLDGPVCAVCDNPVKTVSYWS